jgi:signal transduction histidine kinase
MDNHSERANDEAYDADVVALRVRAYKVILCAAVAQALAGAATYLHGADPWGLRITYAAGVFATVYSISWWAFARGKHVLSDVLFLGISLACIDFTFVAFSPDTAITVCAVFTAGMIVVPETLKIARTTSLGWLLMLHANYVFGVGLRWLIRGRDFAETPNDLGQIILIPIVYLSLLWLLTNLIIKRLEVSLEESESLREDLEGRNAMLEAATLEAEAAKLEAEAANRAKSRFLANMSHELRTPLNAIIGYSDLLLEELDPDEDADTLEDVGRIEGAGRQLLSLIDDVLDLSKIEAGQQTLHVEAFTVADLVADLETIADPLVSRNGNAFEVEVSADLEELRTDATKLRQVITNLLSNAAKFTRDGVVKLAITPATHEGRAAAAFVVEDTGVGMDGETQARVFEAFTQADATVAGAYGGTGLGLHLVELFTGLLEGSVALESTPGVGTRFTVVVPLVHSSDSSS